jgi:hypothetical protein
MPRVVDYKTASQQLRDAGFVSLYHNSGAFGFAPGANVEMLGWIGPADNTIRPELLQRVRQVSVPYALTLAELARQAWQSHLGGECWLTPKSHWHYELHFGNRAMLEAILPRLGIAVGTLRDRNDGSPIVFSSDEGELFRDTITRMLRELHFSDFLLLFPTRATVCTIHHHEQLWWQTTDPAVADALAALAG